MSNIGIENFVNHIFKKCHEDKKGYIDKGYRAKLRKADNPDMEYQSWEILSAWNVDLTKKWERQPYALIASSIAKESNEQNGYHKIGEAIALCYDKGNQSEQAKSTLRRLLACKDINELCQVLRHILSLIRSRSSKNNIKLNYTELLNDLIYFKKDRTTPRWARQFYRKNKQDSEENNENNGGKE